MSTLNRNQIEATLRNLIYYVEKYKHPYIPEGFDTSEAILNENIGNDKTLNKCIKHI